MKHARQQAERKGGLDIIEEATHLIRTAPAATLAAYYAGAIPFVLGLLYFWSDMSRSPFAEQHVAGAALGVSILFLWMKFWQAVFAAGIRSQISGEPPARWTFRRIARVFSIQAAAQPFGLLLIGLVWVAFRVFFLMGVAAMFIAVWSLVLFQNITAAADDGSRRVIRSAWRQWFLWPAQNAVVLGVMCMFGICVFLNWSVVCLLVPQLLKMFFGIESVFTKSPLSMLNSTFLAATLGLSYLCVDPLVKAAYVLRCFYGDSVRTGDDLKADLRRFRLSLGHASAIGVILLTFLCAQSAIAAEAPPAAGQQVSAAPAPALDRAINEVIHEPKYTWRMPRNESAEADTGTAAGFSGKVSALAREWAKAISNWIDDLLRKLSRRQVASGGSGGSGYGWMVMLQLLLYALVAVVIGLLAFLLYRVLSGRRPDAAIATEAIQAVPDITDEHVGADQLPEDGWTRLARELLARGEFRLAMRAFYLAGLAHLAQRNLIGIARFKSNHDYARELRRRAHALPAVVSAFDANVSVFEQIWYGMHEVNGELVNRFASDVERMKSAG